MAEQHSFRGELRFHQRVLPAGRREDELGALGQTRRMRLLHEHRQIGEQQRGEDQIGLGRLERGDMAGQVHGTDLRPLLGDDLVLDVEPLEHRDEGRHVVAAIGIVGIDSGDGDELAFPVFDGEQRGHDRLALVVSRAEQIAWIGDFFVHAVLRRAVPIDRERARFLHHRTECEADARRDDALHAVDLFLLHQLAEALDGVLRRGLVLDHQLDLAPADATLRIVAFDRPLRGANSIEAWRRGDAGARRENADAQRLVLRDHGGEHAPRRQGADGGGGRK